MEPLTLLLLPMNNSFTNKLSVLLLATIVAWLASSCSSDSFKIDGNVEGLGTQNVHIVYQGDNGAVDNIMPTHENEIKVKCHSSRLTVVTVMDMRGQIIARFAASNGDHISFTGHIDHLDAIKVSGNDVTDEWMEFREANASLYNRQPNPELDAAIEKYVKANPKRVSSTLLLLYDHGNLMDNDKTSLLSIIDPEARPDYLIASVEWLAKFYSTTTMKVLHTLNLCGSSGDFETLVIDSQPSLLYFWGKKNEDRRNVVNEIKALCTDKPQVMVADILLDADTLGWSVTSRTVGATWKHYWVPGGVMDNALKDLRIPTTPYFVATDSTGKIVYRGADLPNAIKTLK